MLKRIPGLDLRKRNLALTRPPKNPKLKTHLNLSSQSVSHTHSPARISTDGGCLRLRFQQLCWYVLTIYLCFPYLRVFTRYFFFNYCLESPPLPNQKNNNNNQITFFFVNRKRRLTFSLLYNCTPCLCLLELNVFL